MAYKQNRDKFTGKKLRAIQVWVEIETHVKLAALAKKAKQTLKDYMRAMAERDANG